MVQIGGFLKATGRATLGNVLGRSANILIPLAVISACGADENTDRFFFLLAVAFFFYGTAANALTETTVPLLLSGRLRLVRSTLVRIGFGFTALVLLCAMGWRMFFGGLSPVYAAALALMSGAGLLNGLATGSRYAQETYALPGILWLMRLLPLAVFMLVGARGAGLAWLALGLGGVDWLRGLILIHGSGRVPWTPSSPSPGEIRKSLQSYVIVLAASIIMGLNPIVDRIIAQRLGSGAVTILETGERFYSMLGGLATMGLMTVLLTHLSKQRQANEAASYWVSMLKLIAVWSAFWMLVGGVAGFWGLDLWLAKATPLSTAQSTAVREVYWCYLAGLPMFILAVAYVKRLQARTCFHVLVYTAILAVALNIPASLFLSGIFGVPGIALATTLIYTLNCFMLIGAERYYRLKDASSF